MHPQTLRKYERAGLLTPSRQQGNQRLYSEADVGRLRGSATSLRSAASTSLASNWHSACRTGLTPSGRSTHAELQTAIDEATDMSREP